MNKSSASAKVRCWTLGQDDRGTTAVEFAILAPILIVLLIGVFAIGWAISGLVTVRYALEESSRALVLDPATTQDQLNALVKDKVGDSSVTVSLSIEPQAGDLKLAHVTAAYRFTISIPTFPDYSVDYETSVTVPLAPS